MTDPATVSDPANAEPDTRPGAVVPLHGDRPDTYAMAIEAYLTAAGIAASSRRVYWISLSTWAWLASGVQAPLGKDRRGARPPELALKALDHSVTPETLAKAFAQRAVLVDADTVNRELSVFKAATTWWRSRGWITTNPVAGIERRPAPPDRTRALARRQIDDLYEVKADLREKTLWRLLFESAARAEEVLSLNIEDLVLPDKRAKVISKGGATEWIHWQSPTAQLLPRLITGRKRGPLFLTERLAPSWTPTLEVCPATKRARLSYRRAAEMFEEATRALANPGITDEAELALRGGWTFHQLRHAALTLEAEDGTNTPTLLAISRHASVRSLERYTQVGVDAVARHVARRDPAARRRIGGQPR